jgi:hypothetical protein
MKIIAFDQQHMISDSSLVDAIHTLPEHHYSGIKAIRYAPKGLAMYGMGGPGKMTSGVYYTDLKSIVIRQFSDRRDFYEVLYHEIGHHVFRHVLSIDQRYEWVSKICPGLPGITDYATHNASEDFAESYMTFHLYPGLLRTIKEKYTFMEAEVF